MSVFYYHLKGFEVYLAECSFTYYRVCLYAIILTVVCRKVFDCSRYSLYVKSAAHRTADKSREIGIFGEIFKVSSAKGASVYIDTGAEKSVDSEFEEFYSQKSAECFNELGVEGTSNHCAAGETCRLNTTLKTNSRRAVADTCCGDSEISQRLCKSSERSRCAGAYLKTAHALALCQTRKVKVGKLCNKFIKCVFAVINVGEFNTFVTCVGDFFGLFANIVFFWNNLFPSECTVVVLHTHKLAGGV